jgi:D-alanyl-D-alanine carboxypeptidase/D-alanyl-D-alanine-endopeptidase (penicillin-binding protein 4)
MTRPQLGMLAGGLWVCGSIACASGHGTLASPEVTPVPAAIITPEDQRAILRAAIDSQVKDPRFRNALWGVFIVDPARHDTVYALNEQRLFLPASNMKIVTGAVALAQLGPDFRFRTLFAARGVVRQGVLHGDLVVMGRGDPTVSDHMMQDATLPLRAAAESLAARGIRRITGHVVSAGDAFPDANWGVGWEWDDLIEPYAAGVDELMFNEGMTTVIVRGAARPGTPARVITTPLGDYPPVRAHVTTSEATGGAMPQPLTASYDASSGDLVVSGTIAPADSTTLIVSYRDPASAYLHGLAGALAARGIRLRHDAAHDAPSGEVGGERSSSSDLPPRAGPTPAASRLDTLFALESPPLREILPALEKPSQNQIAEVLLKTLGLEKTGVGSADSGRRVVESQLAAWGADPDGYVIRDGSGLSRHDYVSPATLVRVLTAVERDTAYVAFYNALPVAGVDGTLGDRMRGTPAAGNVRAKTGYVDRARSLSGYVTTADGVGLVFSLLCNNWTVPVHEVERAQDQIVIRLAAITLGGGAR